MVRVPACIIALAFVIAVPQQVPAQQPEGVADTPLPVQRVVLYKAGIGYFEHLGEVEGNHGVTINFTSAQLDDVLKTLTVLDLDGGQVTGIGYNSVAPIEQRLRSLRLPIGERPTLFGFLGALRGARIEVRAGTGAVAGRLLSAEQQARPDGETTRYTEEVSIITDGGEVRRFELGPGVSVRLLEEDLRQEVGRYLALLASARDEDVRRLTVATRGTGRRSIFVGYVSEVPIWKSSYRIVMPAQPDDAPILQGWAIVDNTVGEDWENVELSLVGGAPQSFVQRISQPYYARRPVVPLPERAQLSPQTHGATLTAGSGRIVGEVRDRDGAPLPGASVIAAGGDGETVARAATDAAGRYSLGPLPTGAYEIRFELEGFATQRSPAQVQGGEEIRRDTRLMLAAVEERVSVTGAAPRPEPAPFVSAEAITYDGDEIEPMASGRELGDLFEYRITDPVTIGRNQSALVPILRADVSIEKVSLWSQGTRSGRPLRAVWLTNTSGLSLDGGSFTVLEEGAFAGEGLLEAMKPSERRLLSYGTDVAVLVDEETASEPETVTRIAVLRGVLTHEIDARRRRTYRIRNEDSKPRIVIVEHPSRPGWEITSEALPVETAPGVHRFRVVVEPGQTATLTVAESRPIARRIALSDVTDDHLALFVRQGASGDALERALRPLLDKKAEIAAVVREIAERESEIARIERDQERVRENMKALERSSEERELVRRYARQLGEQEDHLEVLRREIAERSDHRDRLRSELQALIESVSLELGDTPPPVSG